MTEHLLKRFDEELNKLRYRLVKIGTLVQQQIEYALNSLINNNIEHARLVIELENKVDKMDIKIDKQCVKIFALHQPVAMDLRLVISSLLINNDLELIGDFATNVAENVIEMNIAPGLIEKTKMKEMGTLINSISTKLMDSYINMNNELAIEIIKTDVESEILFKENFSILTNLMKSDTNLIETCSFLIDINRNLYSISKQIKGIAQELVFLFEAKMIKHKNLEDLFIDESEGQIEK